MEVGSGRVNECVPGRDQRHGVNACPQVVNIIRKPKGVGMEIKNLCDVDSGIMLVLEIMAPKEEMQNREYAAALGAGTSLLLRLSKSLRNTGRVIVADSAFASVKSAVELKKKHGLYFLGLVKTATREFPKAYLQEADVEERGDSVVLTAKKDNVLLRAVGWNEGKKDKRTGNITKKTLIATCGTTTPGEPHQKRRWAIRPDGSAEYFTKDVKRPGLVADYFSGAQMIDVHNHLRQGSLSLEARPTKRWEWRFFQTFVGMVEVDAYLAYRRFCPGKEDIAHRDFLLEVIDALLNNRYGLPPTAPVLRPRGKGDSPGGSTMLHSLRPLRKAEYFVRKRSAATSSATKQSNRLSCRVCKRLCTTYCHSCTSDEGHYMPTRICAVCGPGTGRECFTVHQTQDVDSNPRKRVRRDGSGRVK
eukprot:INCI9141.2.p1 GENE.INCI9141.2~~INCI9141.2.p1  ORF type:complete len:417 (-),score=52.14 INCI9141.2:214-1464(-)